MNRRGSSTLTGEVVNFEPLRRGSKINKRDEDIEIQFTQETGTVITDTGPKIGKRHIEVLSYFMMLLLNQCMRQHLSLTIVAMTDPDVNQNKEIPTFNWKNKNVILSSFFWGYIGPQVIAGWLMTRYGPKWFIIGSTGICAILGCLIPWSAIQFGSTAVIIARVLQGLCQAFMIPSISCFMSRWIPESERGRSGAFILAGSSLSIVVCMPISGAIAASPYGWLMNFYFFGILVMIWCVYYSFCGCNSPSDHKSITNAEKSFISKTAVDPTKKQQKAPWRKILLSLPFWACTYTFTCNVLIMWILLSQIPTYMSKIMKFDIKSNGFLTSLIYLTQWGVSIIISILSDYLTNKNYLSTTGARKTFTAVGMIIPSISLFFLAHCTEENYTKGVLLLISGVGAAGSNWCAIFINNLDLAPNHAGVLQGFINGFSHIFALLAPLIVQLMVHNENSPEQWEKVFYLSSAVALSGVVIFSLLGSGEQQSWNNIEKAKDQKTDSIE